MKLRSLLLLPLFLLSFLTANAVTIYSSGCSSAETGWTYINTGGNPIQQSGYWMVDVSDEYIISETFDLSSYSNLVLEFDIRSYGSGSHTFLRVEVSDDGGATWNAASYNTNNTTTSYSTKTFNIGTVASSNVKIRFNRPDIGRGVRIDNILFTGDFTSTPCTTPNAPTSLGFSNVTGTTTDGSFSAPAGGADGYVIVRKTTAGAPSPVDGTSYSTGAGLGGQIVDVTASTSFTQTGLSPATTYYYYVFAYNDAGCTGGPKYSAVLSGTQATTALITRVEFVSTSGTVTEGTATYTLTLGITNPNANATSAEVYLTSGSAARINGFGAQTVNFPANSSANQTVTLTITDNSLCEGTDNLSFGLQNISGGSSAIAGTNNTFSLTVNDDDLSNGTQYGQGFEGGASDTWNFSGSGSTYSYAANSGSNGRELRNGESDTYSDVNITGFTNTVISFKTEAEGIENADGFEVYVALNGAPFSGTPELVVGGCSSNPYNTDWDYNANGVATDVVDGVTSTYNASCGSAYNGYATIELTIPDGNTSVSIKLVGNCSSTEYYNYDDLVLTADYCAAPVPTITAAGPLNFGNVNVGSTSTELNYNLTTVDLVDDVNINAPADYAISTTSGGPYSSSLTLTPAQAANTTIFVVYQPTATGANNGVIEHTSTGATQVDVAVTGTGTTPCATPANQATNLVLSPAATSIAGNFTAAVGGADGYLVVVSTSSTLGATPNNTTTYTAGQSLGSGTVVSSATGTSFTATGLSTTTQYYLHVFAYNNALCTGGPLYKTPALVNNATTLASPYVAFDNFDRTDNSTVGVPSSGGATAWSEFEASTGLAEIYNNRLDINNTSPQGEAYVAYNMTGKYATTYDNAVSELVWIFNMSQTRFDPSGFGTSNYGVAMILGATNNDFNDSGNGYAVVLGESGSNDRVKLVRYTGGLSSGTITDLVADGPNTNGINGDYLFNVKVTYTPSTHQWHLFVDEDGFAASGLFDFNDPTAVTYGAGSTVTDQTYTNVDLPYSGALWSYATSSGEYASFDNLNIPTAQTCENTWTGAVSTDWFVAGNWSCGTVPGSSSDVIIPDVSGTTNNFPEVAAAPGSTAYAADLTIENGASVTVLGVNNVNLEVYGNLTNNGAAVVGNGKIVMKGSNPQSINGTINFTHLDIDNAAGVTLGTGTKTVYGTLALVNGTLTTNNRLTIGSNVTRTGLIDEFSATYSGTISGNITVQRYANNTSSNFFYVGSAVSGANVNSFGGFSTGATNGGSNGSQVIPTSTCSITELDASSPYGGIFDYREDQVNTCNLEGWHVRTSGPIGNAQGFAAIVPAGNIININGGFVTGNVTSVNLTYTPNAAPTPAGFNLVANPYAAPIEWNDVASANTGSINGTAYMYQTSGAFAGTYTSVNSVSGGGQIGTSQSFFVETIGNNVTMSFNNSMKRNGTNNTLRTAPVYTDKLTIDVNGNGFADRTIVAFDEDFTAGFDAMFDARKLMSKVGQPSLYVNDGSKYAIYAQPSMDQTQLVPLHFVAGADGVFEISVDMSEFDPTAIIYLEDLRTGTMQNLWVNNTYNFNALAADAADRFVLHFYPPMTIEANGQTCAGNDAVIEFTQPGATVWNMTVTDAQGNVVATEAALNGAYNLNGLADGTYNVSLQHASGYTVNQTINVTGADMVTAHFHNNVLVAEVNQPVNFVNLSSGATTYNWNFGDGYTANTEHATHAFEYPGVYTVELISGNNDCSDSYTTTLKVNDVASGVEELDENIVSVYSYNNIVKLRFTNVGGNYTVKVFDLTGRQMLKPLTVNASGDYEIALNEVAKGYYFVQITGAESVMTKKIFIDSEQ